MSRHFSRQMMGPPPSPEYCAESNKNDILGNTGTFMTVAAIVVILRICVRAFMLSSVGPDDYVMIAALLMAIATFICFVGEAQYAVGRHAQCIPPADMRMFSLWQYFHSTFIMVGVVLVKISVALFLMRLVPPGKRWKRFLWGCIVFLVCFMLACAGTIIFACTPVDASWNFEKRLQKGTRCFSNETYTNIGLTNSSINCATDFLFAILPIPIIIKLQVNKRTKVILAVILSLGYFACAAGIVKAVKQHGFFRETDPLWHNSFNVWNMIECCVGIIAASLPSLRPLFAKLLDKGKTIFSSGSKGSRSRSVFDGHAHHEQNARVLGGDIKMQGWRDNSNSTSTGTDNTHLKSVSEHEQDNSHGHSQMRRADRHTLCVTDVGDDGSWEDIEVLRSQSEEQLTRPPGIMKTMDITTIEHYEAKK